MKLRSSTMICLLAVAFALVSEPAVADERRTPGSIARLTVPAGWTHLYDPASDITTLNTRATDQVLLIVTPFSEPRTTLVQLLNELGAGHLSGRIEDVGLGGLPGARFEVTTDISELWFALTTDGATMIVRVASRGRVESLLPVVEELVGTIELAPARHPQSLCGSYRSRGTVSPGYDDLTGYDVTIISLGARGEVTMSSQLGVSGQSGGAQSTSQTRGHWEVRGNRLLVRLGTEASNFRYQVFANGIELVDTSGEQLMWSKTGSQ